MKFTGFVRLFATTALLLFMAAAIACSKSNNNPTTARASSEGGKIPITTKSQEAKNEFLQGRDLADKLLAQDALAHFDRAISLDPEFASAELARANASAINKDFAPAEGGQPGGQSIGRRETSYTRKPGSSERGHGEAERVSGQTCGPISER
jgi:hypothetical protein